MPSLQPREALAKCRKKWADWKSSPKRVASQHRRNSQGTGGGPAPAPVEGIQEKAVAIIGSGVCDGIEEYLESGDYAEVKNGKEKETQHRIPLR